MLVEFGHAFGETDGLASGDGDTEALITCTPPGDGGKLRACQRSAGVDAEIGDTQQRDPCVDGDGRRSYGQRAATRIRNAARTPSAMRGRRNWREAH